MLTQEKGTLSGSEEFRLEVSDTARDKLFYATDCGVYYTDTNYSVERDDYGNYLMLYVSQGILAVSMDGETSLVKKGQVAFLNCRHSHAYYAKVNTTFWWIHFKGSNTGELFEEYMKRRGGLVFEIEGEALQTTQKNITQIISRYQNDLGHDEGRNSCLLYECMISMIFAKSDALKASADDSVRRAKDYIFEHIDENLTLNKVAEIVGLSGSHFSRIFKKETSYSPYEYIILVRINKAKHLLRTTNLTVKEVAYSVGYRSESNFCNGFTQRIGISPIQFKKMCEIT